MYALGALSTNRGYFSLLMPKAMEAVGHEQKPPNP